MVSLLMSIVYSELKQHEILCASITMSAINACRLCQASIGSKNSIALLSTTRIQHKWTDRIVYLLEASGNKSVISRRCHTKTSFPLYTESIMDRCSGLGLSSGLSNCWRTYERQWCGSFASDDVCKKAVQYCYYIAHCWTCVHNMWKRWNSTAIKRMCKWLKPDPFSSSASSGLGMRLASDIVCLLTPHS